MSDPIPTRYDVVLFAACGSYERLHQLAGLVAAAAAGGRRVLVVWRGLALRRLCEGTLDEDDLERRHGTAGLAMSRAMTEADLPTPSRMLEDARILGGVRHLACPTDVVAAGVSRARAEAVLDDLESLPTLVDLAATADLALVL